MAASSSKSTLGECSSSAILRRELQPRAHNEDTTPHDIFLSHSGVQKHFVKGLYNRLSPLYSTFFDIKHHSLPPGEIFSTHIFDNAKTCKLGVVVLSKDFVLSKWPMRELSAFVDAMDAMHAVRILPLFYDLSPKDVKCTDKWLEEWQKLAAQEDVSKWVNALGTVGSIGGLVFDKSKGEADFLEEIVSAIYGIIPPTLKYNDTHIFGKNRLCKVILNKFEAMESCHGQQMEQNDQPKPCVLGMYGLPGSGKSTLSKILKEHLFSHYGGKVLYLELPTTSTSPMDLIDIFKRLLSLTDFRARINLDISDLSMVFSLLKIYRLQKQTVFVVVDNIVNDIALEAVKDFLDVGVGRGSKVLLVARTLDFLQEALVRGKEGQHFISDSMGVPRISEKEALDILLHTPGGCVGGDDHAVEAIVDVVRMCGFGSRQDDLLYLPLAMKTMGALLVRFEGDVKKWKNVFLSAKKVKTHKEHVLKTLVRTSFEQLGDEQLQLLFLDVTLFILPLNLGSVQEAKRAWK